MSGQEFPGSVERFVGTLNHLLRSSVSTTATFDARLSSGGTEAVIQVRHGPDGAVGALEALGYGVTAPSV